MGKSKDKLARFAIAIFLILFLTFFIWVILSSKRPAPSYLPVSKHLSGEQRESLRKAKEKWQAEKKTTSKYSKSPSLKSFNLSYEKRKEIYINYTEDPSWDFPNGFSKKWMDYRMEKYTKRFNISEGDMLRIITEGVQKGW